MFRTFAALACTGGLTLAGSLANPAAAMPADVPHCDTTKLAPSASPAEGGGGMSKTVYDLNFENTSDQTCKLKGFPGVNPMDHNGGSFGAPAKRTDATPEEVVLNPGESATAYLTITSADVIEGCNAEEASGLLVWAPDANESQPVNLTYRACGNPEVSNLKIGPVAQN